jgi:hypothetical protein
MSVQYKAKIVYGYRFPADRYELIPEDILDNWFQVVDGWGENDFILGILCQSTEEIEKLDLKISHIQNTDVQKMFKELPDEVVEGISGIPYYWLVQEVS